MPLSNRPFAVLRADSITLRDQVHQLRYQAYCIENAFEQCTDHPGGREKDAFDDRALHSLLIHKPTRTPVGSVRLILRDPRAPARLPIELACGDLAALRSVHSAGHRLGEVSRFCLSREALKQARHAGAGSRVGGASEGLTATLTLISAVVGMAAAEGVTHLCALMAPTLVRLLAGFGLVWRELGPPIEHHGLRQPVFSHLGDLLAGAHQVRPDAWALITENGRLWPLPAPDLARLEAVA